MLWTAVTSADPARVDEATRIGIVRAMLEANCTELADGVITHFWATACETVLACLAESDAVPRRLDPASQRSSSVPWWARARSMRRRSR